MCIRDRSWPPVGRTCGGPHAPCRFPPLLPAPPCPPAALCSTLSCIHHFTVSGSAASSPQGHSGISCAAAQHPARRIRPAGEIPDSAARFPSSWHHPPLTGIRFRLHNQDNRCTGITTIPNRRTPLPNPAQEEIIVRGGKITLDALSTSIRSGEIDTVITAVCDMQGRLIGKRVTGDFFLDHCLEHGTHFCTYLLATDMEMNTPEGFAHLDWESGYGDYLAKPDWDTLRVLPWHEGTALVLCDAVDAATDAMVDIAPRGILRRQVERAAALGFLPRIATALEFYKGEAAPGQHEVNIHYDNALESAARAVLCKHGAKEIAWRHGHAITFMSKPHHTWTGSSGHIHISLWDADCLFYTSD